MKALLSFTVILLISGFECFCRDKNTIPEDSLKQLRRQEVDFIFKALRENSIDTLRGLTAAEWIAGKNEIYKKTGEAKTPHEYLYALRYFGTLINDAHSMFPNTGIYNALGIFSKTDTIFPVWVKSWHDNRVFTVKDFSETLPEYSEIISINGIPAREISINQHRLIPYEERAARAYTLSTEEGDPAVWTSFANYLFCEGIKPPFSVEYKINDSVCKVTLCGMKREKISKILYREHPEVKENPWRTIFKTGKNTVNYRKINDTVGVLKIKMFLGVSFFKMLMSGGDFGFPKRLKSCMDSIHNDGIKHLTVDLRDNPGGYLYNVYELLACFTGEIFTAGDVYKLSDNNRKSIARVLKRDFKTVYGKSAKKNPDVARTLEILNSMPSDATFRSDTLLSMRYNPQYEGKRFTGTVYLLTNAECYSASIEFANIFQSRKLGLVAGESPGGYTVVTSGNTVSLRLPLSKYFRIEPSSSQTGNRIKYEYFYLTPDIPIEPSFDEWLYKKHDALEKLIEMIKN